MVKFFLNPREMVASPRQGVKIYKSFPVVYKSKLGAFYNAFFGAVGSLATNMVRNQIKKPNQQMCMQLATTRKKVRSVIQWRLE